MSDVPTDPTRDAASSAGGDQPSPEEVRAYLDQLRAAPVEQIVAEVASALVNAAQVKLGRKDARLLIDLVGAIAETGRKGLTADIVGQLDQALTQLRMAQVEAEREVSEGEADTADLGQGRAASDRAEPGERSAGAPPPPSPQRPASRLWTPGG